MCAFPFQTPEQCRWEGVYCVVDCRKLANWSESSTKIVNYIFPTLLHLHFVQFHFLPINYAIIYKCWCAIYSAALPPPPRLYCFLWSVTTTCFVVNKQVNSRYQVWIKTLKGIIFTTGSLSDNADTRAIYGHRQISNVCTPKLISNSCYRFQK